jgi:hypothetical protein
MWEGALDWHADSSSSSSGGGGMSHRHVPEDMGIHSTDVIVREARRVIAARAASAKAAAAAAAAAAGGREDEEEDPTTPQPLFLYLPFVAPHLPTQPAPGFAERNTHVSTLLRSANLSSQP